ncbi:glutamine amidotransferase [Microbacterium sp. STN6]|uniref:glutamine amidotransferase n=1 Tax=Microbacterium sp. STN6 TaxID=2995588 RepID=UPI002260AAC5|nr:glutamine amidotransferase [Microbacterium sp. STN6]MCX7523108.1 glutamine amidotransferase [Microbacterium sp. STN6]
MKPFLLLATRDEDAVADDEYGAFLRLAGLERGQLRRIRLEREPMPALELTDYSGVFVGGSPLNTSDPAETKSPVHVRVEREMAALLDEVVARDVPFLGACYGIGTLGVHQGGTVDRRFGEAVGAVRISVTDAGQSDPLFAGIPPAFDAFVGHKEACSTAPPNAVLLASGAACPVQAFRVGRNVYATQFHPELELDGLIARVHAYRDHGYFAPDETDAVIAAARAAAPVTWPARILSNFVARYAKP